jgi:hypothetical protein
MGIIFDNANENITGSSGNVTIDGNDGYRSINQQIFTSNGTWTPSTPNVRAVLVEVIGGGGGSGGCAATIAGERAESACGGGGGFSRKFITSGLGPSESVTVGVGGTGGSAGLNAGGTGGTSSFGSHLSATGGVGGGGGNNTGGTTTSFGGAGGTGSGGDLNISGGDGSPGVVRLGSGTTPAQIWRVESGGTVYSAPQKTGASNSSGLVGFFPGGGGSSATSEPSQSARAGSSGAPGVVIVYEFE